MVWPIGILSVTEQPWLVLRQLLKLGLAEWR